MRWHVLRTAGCYTRRLKGSPPWLELAVFDASGRVIAQAGQGHAKAEDPSAFVLRALQVDARGRPETQHIVTRFGTAVYDHTLPPMAARTVRYSFLVPEGVVLPLSVSARVQHRRHRKEARDLACEATKSQRGRAFIAAARARGEATFDGCRPEPITLVAQVELQLGAASAAALRPSWARLYDHALGLAVSVQEDLQEARWSALQAWDELAHVPEVPAPERAKVLTLLGRIGARQGRLAESLEYTARAQTLIGEHAAIERVRADAYMQVWKWSEAATTLTTLTRLAPGDTAAWRDLARARYSAGDAQGALTAAQSGMGLQPRDEGCLRVQALALEALKSPEAAAARKSFVFYREADESSSARMACDRVVPNCKRDRDPVVKIELGPVSAGKLLARALQK